MGGLGLDGGGSTNGDRPIGEGDTPIGEDDTPTEEDDPPNGPLSLLEPGEVVVEITGPGSTGNTEEWTPLVDGYYLIELWGSQGWEPSTDPARPYGGRGAYVRGVLEITPEEVSGGQKLYVTVGVPSYSGMGSGGGASDVRWNGNTLYDRIIVAAGGGGAHDKYYSDYKPRVTGYTTGGYGGALTGGNASGGYDNGGGASQTGGGLAGYTSAYPTNKGNDGTFGEGGIHYRYSVDSNYDDPHGNGGDGYWGGGSGGNTNWNGAGGGGSSFISGYAGCVAIIANGETGPRDGTDNSVQKATHYSGKIFSPTVTIGGINHETVMIAGNATMPTPAGGTETGHSGGGYARVIYLGKPSVE